MTANNTSLNTLSSVCSTLKRMLLFGLCRYMTTNNTSFNSNESLFYAPDGTLAFK